MIKLNASYSKKVPGAEDYSSEGYLCSVELELSDTLEPQQLQQRIHDTFTLVKDSVESELELNRTQKHSAAPRANGRNGAPTTSAQDTHEPANGNGQGNGKATNKQLHYLTSLAAERGKGLGELNAEVANRFGVRDLYGLNRRQASLLLDELKAA